MRIGKYLVVILIPNVPGRKTHAWTVEGLYDNILGMISWYSAWRQYTFDPEPGTTFNKECLDDLAKFLGKINKEHKLKSTKAKERKNEIASRDANREMGIDESLLDEDWGAK